MHWRYGKLGILVFYYLGCFNITLFRCQLKPVCGMISPVCEFCRCRIDQFDETFQPQQKEYVVEKIRTDTEAPNDDPFNCVEIDIKPDTSELDDVTEESRKENCGFADFREVAVEAVLEKVNKETIFLNCDNTKQDFDETEILAEETGNDDEGDGPNCSDEESLPVEPTDIEKKEKKNSDTEQVILKRPTECNICGKSVTYMKDHMRLHNKEKKFKCPHCDRSFTQSNNLIYHVRKHTGEKPFPCDKCDKSFICKSHLLSHLVCNSFIVLKYFTKNIVFPAFAY